MMVRRDTKYYEAHAQTISITLEEITSSDNNADIIQRLRANDPTFNFLQITGDNDYIDNDYTHHYFFIGRRDDLGWLGYFVGISYALQHLCIESLPETIGVNRVEAFIEGLNRNRSIETLYIDADLGSGFRQLGDFFRNNNNLTDLSFGNMYAVGVESARSIAFMLSQPEQSNLRELSFEESNASEAVLAVIATAISNHPHLEELNLGNNNLGRDGSVALGKAFQACNNPRLQNLFLYDNSIDDEGLGALGDGMSNCHNLSRLNLSCNDLITVDGFRSLSTLFQSDCCQLKYLDLDSMNIEDDGAHVIATGLASLNLLEELHLSDNTIGDDGARALGAGLVNLRSLEKLCLGDNSIGDDGASAIAAGLASLHLLEALFLSDNSISDAGVSALAAGLASLSLERLDLENNSISDLGFRALADSLLGCDNNLKYLSLSGNRSITASGLASLSALLQSESCSLVWICLKGIPFGDDGAVALADALKGNKSMKHLYFDPDSARVTSGGWSAFSKLVCDTSSVSATYLSNHSLETIGKRDSGGAPSDVKALLVLNKHAVEHAAIRKILNIHPDFDIEPFFEWKLKLLPILVSWFDRVRTLADVDDHSWILDETSEDQCRHNWISDETSQAFQSRQLSSMYNFVRGMPLMTIGGYRSRNNATTLAQTKKRKIEHLEDES